MDEGFDSHKPPHDSTKQIIDADHFPDVVENGKGIKRVERLGVVEKLKNSDERRELFSNLTDEQYKKVLGYINSLSKGEKINYEYQDGQVPMMDTPPLEDKSRLMDMTFGTIREILKDDNLNNQVALRTAALTMAGAVNYIHPYENGNGRVGRVMHYLIEYGTERGNDAFENELYAIIGKLKVFDSEMAKAFDDTPPAELERALTGYVMESNNGQKIENRELASKRVEAFLEMMTGKINVPIESEVVLRNIVQGKVGEGLPEKETIPKGSINGKDLYEKQYLYYSTIPNRNPNDIPQGSKRVKGERAAPNLQKIMLSLELI